jgi:hypothetical protein
MPARVWAAQVSEDGGAEAEIRLPALDTSVGGGADAPGPVPHDAATSAARTSGSERSDLHPRFRLEYAMAQD